MTDHFVPSRFQQLEHRYLTAQLAGDRQLILPKESVNRELAIGRIRDALAKACEAAMRQERRRG